MRHNHQAWEPPLLKPRAPRARAPHKRGHCSEKPVPATGEEPCTTSNNKDPAQRKINGFKKENTYWGWETAIQETWWWSEMPGDKATARPLHLRRTTDCVEMGRQPEGVGGRTFQTAEENPKTRPQSQLGLVWSGVPGGWGWRRGRECQELCPLRVWERIWICQGNTSCKDGHNKGQKWYGLNRSRRY